MPDEPGPEIQLPTDVLQSLLRERTADPTATITDLHALEIPLLENAAKHLYRVQLTWTGQNGPATASWVAKLWQPQGFTGLFMQVSRPLEALAWQAGLLAPSTLPAGMAVPYIGATVDDSGARAWIVMEDVSPAIDAVQEGEAVDDKIELAKLVLDRLAHWHVLWEQPERQATLDANPWLIGQGQRLRCGADVYAICLGHEPLNIKETTPAMRQAICPPTRNFVQMLPYPVRLTWEELVYRRDRLVHAFSDLPQTLLHGDLYLGQAGLRRGNDTSEVLFLDWEWIGRGSPAFDVRQLIQDVAPFGRPGALDHSLSDVYFDAYQNHGGTRMDRLTWDKAYALATIFEGVRVFPFIAGGSLDEDSMFHGWLDEQAIRMKIDEVSQAIETWLR